MEKIIDPGNQECKGIWLDLAIAPANSNSPIIVIAVSLKCEVKLNALTNGKSLTQAKPKTNKQ